MTTDPGLAEAIDRGWAESDRDHPAATIDHFRALAERHPDDAVALYELGGALDWAGDEERAVEPYRRALAMGLEGTDLRRCHAQLGSTLRVLGRLDESIAVLEEGLDEFPASRSLRTFLALALHDAGRHDEALGVLLEVLVDPAASPDLAHYARALRGYARDLRRRGR